MPPRAGLIVVRENDPNYGLSDTETQDRIEFIRCYLLKDFEAILLVTIQDYGDEFFVQDHLVTDGGYSAFNTTDFHNTMRPFNKYGYAMKKIMERVKDLAVMHSCISQDQHRKEVYERYKNYVARKFGFQLDINTGYKIGVVGEDWIYQTSDCQFHPPPLQFNKTMEVFIMESDAEIEIKKASESAQVNYPIQESGRNVKMPVPRQAMGPNCM